MDLKLPGPLKTAVERGNPKKWGSKKAEKIKEIDRQLEELVVEAKASPGPGEAHEQAKGPFTAVALAVGKMFRPSRDDSLMIDEQLNQVLAESENLEDEPPPQVATDKAAAQKAAVEEMIASRAKTIDSGGRPETGVKVDEVKTDMAKQEATAAAGGMSAEQAKAPAAAPDGGAPKSPPEETKPGAINFRDELMSKLAETAKVEKDVSLDIMRDMRDRKVNCDELQGDLLEISILLKKSAKVKIK